MKILSSKNLMGWVLSLVAVFVIGSLEVARHAWAQEGEHGKIYAVTHIDIIPPETATGTKLVQQYVADSRKDKGFVRIESYAQISRLNHISIVEVWESQKAYDEHIAAPHTRQFRQQLDPKLGSPYDERLHQLLE